MTDTMDWFDHKYDSTKICVLPDAENPLLTNLEGADLDYYRECMVTRNPHRGPKPLGWDDQVPEWSHAMKDMEYYHLSPFYLAAEFHKQLQYNTQQDIEELALQNEKIQIQSHFISIDDNDQPDDHKANQTLNNEQDNHHLVNKASKTSSIISIDDEQDDDQQDNDQQANDPQENDQQQDNDHLVTLNNKPNETSSISSADKQHQDDKANKNDKTTSNISSDHKEDLNILSDNNKEQHEDDDYLLILNDKSNKNGKPKKNDKEQDEDDDYLLILNDNSNKNDKKQDKDEDDDDLLILNDNSNKNGKGKKNGKAKNKCKGKKNGKTKKPSKVFERMTIYIPDNENDILPSFISPQGKLSIEQIFKPNDDDIQFVSNPRKRKIQLTNASQPPFKKQNTD